MYPRRPPPDQRRAADPAKDPSDPGQFYPAPPRPQSVNPPAPDGMADPSPYAAYAPRPPQQRDHAHAPDGFYKPQQQPPAMPQPQNGFQSFDASAGSGGQPFGYANGGGGANGYAPQNNNSGLGYDQGPGANGFSMPLPTAPQPAPQPQSFQPYENNNATNNAQAYGQFQQPPIPPASNTFIPPAQQAQPQSQMAPNQQMPGAQSAVPVMMAGLQQMTAAAVAGGTPFNPALGAQLIQTLAPGAAGYTAQVFGDSQERMKSFMRMPKYYFAVNHRYVLRKLSLILMPFANRTWSRQRGMDPANYGGSPSADGTSYLPPRDDVNAPDLYIPVMAFMSYVMVVGFVYGVRNAFKADVLAKSFSKGLGLLSMEVLIIKLGLYLINARPTPWLDVIAYRGYKFVGVVLTIVLGLAVPKLYIPVLLYSATAMGIFLMRSHRRIILPRDVDPQHASDLARRNMFLLFLSVLQFPIYWLLARVVDVKLR